MDVTPYHSIVYPPVRLCTCVPFIFCLYNLSVPKEWAPTMHLDKPAGDCCYCGDEDNNRLIKNRMQRWSEVWEDGWTCVCVCVRFCIIRACRRSATSVITHWLGLIAIVCAFCAWVCVCVCKPHQWRLFYILALFHCLSFFLSFSCCMFFCTFTCFHPGKFKTIPAVSCWVKLQICQLFDVSIKVWASLIHS